MEKKLINSYPASCWNDTTPVGNGVLGLSVYGCVYDERILINHESLYNWVCDTGYPDISEHLPTLRRLMDEGKYREANNYYTELIKDSGFRSNKGNSSLPSIYIWCLIPALLPVITRESLIWKMAFAPFPIPRTE